MGLVTSVAFSLILFQYAHSQCCPYGYENDSLESYLANCGQKVNGHCQGDSCNAQQAPSSEKCGAGNYLSDCDYEQRGGGVFWTIEGTCKTDDNCGCTNAQRTFYDADWPWYEVTSTESINCD